MGGRGNLIYPRSKVYPTGEAGRRVKPAPPDFRERYLEEGWDYQWVAGCGWKTFCRWIDQCGGDELRAARAAVVRTSKRKLRSCVGSYSNSDTAWFEKRKR